MTKEFDYIVVGGGSGGIASANRAAEHGAKVAVIEEYQLGGTCVNRGCVPKKVAWYASKVGDAIHRYGPGYGFNAENVTFDYSEFKRAQEGYVARSRQGYFNRFESNDITLIQGHAELKGNQEVEVNGETYRAKHILLATGGRPKNIEVPGGHLLSNSDDFFKWEDLPETVAVVGAGYIAVELAQVLHGLGVETNLVVRHDRPLRSFDKDIVNEWMALNEANGPKLMYHTDFDEYREEDGKIVCMQDGRKILTVDRVIQAIGRHPNTEHLGLENTAVELDEAGHIVVDEGHETAEKGVYALGDVIDRIDLTPVAIRAGRQLSEFLFNNAATSEIDYSNVPTVVFSHPAIGTIGLNERQAREIYDESTIKVYTNRFFSMYASAAWHREPNFFKLICVGEEERVVGLHGIGEGVDEMIQGFGVAMKMGATKKDFDSVVAIHPTGAEEFVTMR
ncbi:glutathione-disulfide reductase [Aerococcaceae bacterium DSM 111022]|nr:glutathione-disulfide reductase [Aerococcaceae bacterium DSM 111022]